MDISRRTYIERTFARTYGPDAWEKVEAYRYARENADAMSGAAIGRETGYSGSTIRAWLNDTATPDPVRGLQTAAENDWLNLEWTISPFTGLNVLCAWIFAGGSINKHYLPSWTVRTREQTPLETAFYLANVSVDRVHERTSGRTAEYRPESDATILGRVLVALGAPHRTKTDDSLQLPEYLAEAPVITKVDFARAYVYHRGTVRKDRSSMPIQIREKRSKSYRNELIDFLRGLTGHDDCVRGRTETIYLRPRAAAVCCGRPLFGKWL